MRLFIALHLDPETRAAVGAIQSSLRAADRRGQVRWVDPHGIHLTLRFLGEVDEARAARVIEALDGAVGGRPACRLAISRAGAFPNLSHARVLWLGLLEEGVALAPLQAAVESALQPLGWPPEERPFQPHLTLGRVREGSGRRPQKLLPELLQAVERAVPAVAGSQIQDRVSLVRSHLSPSGARYEDLRSWKLER